MFNTRSNTEKRVENTTYRQVVLTKFEVFDTLCNETNLLY